MEEYKEKRKIRKIIYSNWSFAFLFVILMILVFSSAKVYVKSRNAALRNKEVKESLVASENRQTELDSETERLQSESGAEEEIRKKFNVGKPGEKILMIIDKEAEGDTMKQQKKLDIFFFKILSAIKNIF